MAKMQTLTCNSEGLV